MCIKHYLEQVKTNILQYKKQYNLIQYMYSTYMYNTIHLQKNIIVYKSKTFIIYKH